MNEKSQLLIKVASVLDVLAEDHERGVAEKVATERARREEMLSPVLDKLALVTGEDHDSLRNKLAQADPDVLNVLTKVAAEGTITELGGPETRKTASALNHNEKTAAADERFGDWIVS